MTGRPEDDDVDSEDRSRFPIYLRAADLRLLQHERMPDLVLLEFKAEGYPIRIYLDRNLLQILSTEAAAAFAKLEGR